MAKPEFRPASERGAESTRLAPTHADWIGEQIPTGGFDLYMAVLRSRLWLIILTVATAVLTTTVIVATKQKVYTAEAELLATALPHEDVDLLGLGLPTESGDPTRDIETIAQLVATPSVAERVRRRLGLQTSARDLLKQVSAQPIAQSGIVSVTARANKPALAADLANGFGVAARAEGTARFESVVDSLLPGLKAQLAKLPPSDAAARDALAGRIQTLETQRAAGDPTLRQITTAIPPTHASSPRRVLSVAAAFIGGLVLAVGLILALHLLDPRILLEDELRQYRIPVLARIPISRGSGRFSSSPALGPRDLSPATADAYRRLASSFVTTIDWREPHTIFVTAAAPSTGKSTSAINLAASLAEMEKQVVLVDADSRRPALSRVLALSNGRGLASVVAGEAPLEEVLEGSHRLPTNVRVLPQDQSGASAPAFITGEAAEMLVRDVISAADWTVFDGPALNYAPEPLPIAMRADTVLVVVRIGTTRRRDLAELAEVLVQHDIAPSGFIILGAGAKPVYY